MGLLLETFDDEHASDAAAGLSSGPSPDWVAGHAEGLAEGIAAGEARAEARESAIGAELAQALQDMAFGYAEARGAVLASLHPLFRAVTERLLPALAAEALAPWIAEAVAEAARADSAAPLIVVVHPSRVAALRARLPTGPGSPLALRADPALGPNAARIAALEGETALDLDACLHALAETLGAIFDEPTRKAYHG